MKHAYLIMAHNEWELLNKLVNALDYPDNDIYLHIDKKSKFDKACIDIPKYSRIYYVKRRNVNWGGDSQIKCILEMLSTAYKRRYSYYHLLSGVDVPIEPQETIHKFFEENNGKNYLSFDFSQNYAEIRLGQYHLFQNLIGRNKGHLVAIVYGIEQFLLNFQKKIGVNRIKKSNVIFYKGGGWFSITDEMVVELLHSKKLIKKYFYKTIGADELFLQTIACNGALSDTVIDNDLRCIDWKRGNPYIFRKEDYKLICNSGKLFARKFSSNIDREIVNALYSKLYNNEQNV